MLRGIRHLNSYGDNFYEIIVKTDFKYQGYGLHTILLQGHAVTLTFKVATEIFRGTYRLKMVIISVK
jgi:hypothetical protein